MPTKAPYYKTANIGPGTIFPHTIGVRLTREDMAHLEQLATVTHRSPSEVLRILLRMAQARDVPAVELHGGGRDDD